MQPFSCGQNLRQKLNSSDDGASLQQTADREIIKHMCKDDRRYAPTKENQVELYLSINQHQSALSSINQPQAHSVSINQHIKQHQSTFVIDLATIIQALMFKIYEEREEVIERF